MEAITEPFKSLKAGTKNALVFLSGGGEMGECIRNFNWSETPLGSPEQWPQSLRTTVSLCLASNFPINIIWGKERNQIYNDGYWPLCGDKHPISMGQDFKECWFSAWSALGEAFESALKGETRFLVNQRMFLDRYGYLEETFFTFSFSPIRDESGNVGGLFHPVTELTQQTLSERRLNVVRELSDRTADARSVGEVSKLITETLSRHELDLPFTLLYLLNEDNTTARLIGNTGLTGGATLSPTLVDLTALGKKDWPLADVSRSKQVIIVDDLEKQFGSFSCGPYPEPPKVAVVMPISVSGLKHPLGVLITGVSSRRGFDEHYRTFYNLLNAAVTNAITNARSYEEERKRAEALAEIDKAKTVFFSNISHEFRTPITLMLGPLEELINATKSNLSQKEKQNIETTHRNAMRMLKLVNTLLDFSRIESGRQQAAYTLVNIASLTTNLAANFRSVIERAGLEFIVKADSSQQPVYVDRQMWEKIVFNLLSNAFKYTLKGRISLDVFCDDHSAMLTVEDTGVGIPEKELPRMFERFHRVESVSGRTHEGTGIGLSLIKELVRLHGGNIGVESKEGKGTKFTVTIPFGKNHLPAAQIKDGGKQDLEDVISNVYVEEAFTLLEPAKAKLKIESDAFAENKDAATVLIVDDNADMRLYIESLLNRKYRAVTASNGMDALHKISSEKPNLILSDIMMPVMDGIQLLKEIKQNPQTANIPVILITARAGEESKIEGYETGAEDYLVKPFSAKELMARVAAQIKITRTRKHIQQQLYNMIMQAPVAICVMRSSNYVIEIANEKMIAIMGKPAEQLINKPVFEGSPEVAAQGFIQLLDNVCKTGIRFISEETPVDLMRNGKMEHVFLRFVYEPLREEDGSVNGVMAVATDITDQVIARKKIEENEQRLEILVDERTKELLQANKELESFNYIASHDLQEPLRKIRTFVNLIERDIDNKQSVVKYLNKVELSTQRMTALIKDVLHYSSLNNNKTDETFTNVDLNQILENVKTDFELVIDQKEAVINADKLPVIKGIPFQINQLFSNLIGNALKFSERTPVIKISARSLSKQEAGKYPELNSEKNYVELIFADNGIGFDQKHADQIFTIFHRLHGRDTFSGTGIGLSLCKKIVQNHNGIIHAEGVEGKGATFTINLPKEN